MPKPSDPNLTAYWREQFSAWQGSGLSQRAFCQANDLNYARFGYWRRKFRQEKQVQRPGFVPVTRTPEGGGLSLVLPNGCQIRNIGPHNVEIAAQLLARLA